jgi:pimeloyl-ACP methyl ester carboxylesterase
VEEDPFQLPVTSYSPLRYLLSSTKLPPIPNVYSPTVMPYVDIAQGNDFASIWYITNSPTGHVSSFDPDKPTLILLHPFFLDTTWLDNQFGDPRLNCEYNLIAFDQRAAGRTLSRPNGKQDSWTDAADLAFACHVRK